MGMRFVDGESLASAGIILGLGVGMVGCTRDPAPGAGPGAGAAEERASSDGPAPAAGVADDGPAAEASILARGRAAFDQGRCGKCHGEDGSGSERGPDLTDGAWMHIDGSVGSIRALLDTGVSRERLVDPARPFPMNPASRLVPDGADLDALAAYVRSLSA